MRENLSQSIDNHCLPMSLLTKRSCGLDSTEEDADEPDDDDVQDDNVVVIDRWSPIRKCETFSPFYAFKFR